MVHANGEVDTLYWPQILRTPLMAREKKPEEGDSIVAANFEKDEPLQRPQQEAAEKHLTIDMVREAIAAGQATAKVGLPWIKEKFGVEMQPGNFSVTKPTIERGNKKAAGSESAPKRTFTPRKIKEPALAAAVTPTPVQQANGHMSPREAARSVKDLVDKLGAKEVKNLVELLGGRI